jgi:hypothetical protein
MARFFYAQELRRPEDVKPFLADEKHWKPGYSACELATAWIGAGDIPGSVRTVSEQRRYFRRLSPHRGLLRASGRSAHTRGAFPASWLVSLSLHPSLERP